MTSLIESYEPENRRVPPRNTVSGKQDLKVPGKHQIKNRIERLKEIRRRTNDVVDVGKNPHGGDSMCCTKKFNSTDPQRTCL